MSTATEMSPADRMAHDLASHIRRTPDVDRFHALSDMIDRVSSRDSHYMTTSEVIDLHDMQEERARIYFQLAAAGMLHLVEAAEHDRTKEPLPPRPRGPHPYPTGTVA